MGCHTWFYTKIETPADAEIKSVVVNQLMREADFNMRLVNQRNTIEDVILENYPEWTPEYAAECLERVNQIIDSVNNDTIDRDELYQMYCDYAEDLMRWVSGRGFYQEVDDYHDLFRRNGYPNDMFFSYVDTMDYINNPDNQCYTYEYTESALQRFWSKYPNGMVCFG
jgi:hypothetical protein